MTYENRANLGSVQSTDPDCYLQPFYLYAMYSAASIVFLIDQYNPKKVVIATRK